MRASRRPENKECSDCKGLRIRQYFQGYLFKACTLTTIAWNCNIFNRYSLETRSSNSSCQVDSKPEEGNQSLS
jgi:hypothetical protein